MSTKTTHGDPRTRRRQPAAGHTRSFTRRDKIAMAITIVALLPLAIAFFYPFFWVVTSSVKDNNAIFGSLNPFTPVLKLSNYIRAWQDASMGQYLFNTVFVTFFAVVISVSTNCFMGYVLGRYAFPGKKVIFVLLALVVFLPQGYTVIPIFDLIAKLGLDGSLWGVTLAEAGGVSVVLVLLFAGYFGQIPAELEESARIDGAGFWRIFARIYLPLAKPVIATGIILQFMHTWNDFLLPLVLTLSRPELRTLSVGIYSLQNQFYSDWGLMTAGSAIALIPIIVLFVFLQRYFVESFSGAIKG